MHNNDIRILATILEWMGSVITDKRKAVRIIKRPLRILEDLLAEFSL